MFEKQIHIQIPDPNMKQDDESYPNFISTIPPSIEGLEVRVHINIDKAMNGFPIYKKYKKIANYLLKVSIKARKQGVFVNRFFDFETSQEVYQFSKIFNPKLKDEKQSNSLIIYKAIAEHLIEKYCPGQTEFNIDGQILTLMEE